MARSNRTMAQRYAAANKKRRKGGRTAQSPAGGTAQGEGVNLGPVSMLPSSPAAAPQAPARPPARPAAETTPPPATSPAPSVARARPGSPRAAADYSEQYRYVRSDIRRVAILTTILVVLLVALSFVIG